MWTKKFWQDAAERAIKTFVIVLLTAVTAGGVVSTDLAIWKAAIVSAGISVVFSLLSTLRGDPGSASLIKDTPPTSPF